MNLCISPEASAAFSRSAGGCATATAGWRVQWPNAALWVWVATLLLRWIGALASHGVALAGVARGALIVWALDEVVRGANPFRRMLSAVVLTVQLAIFA